MYAVVRKAAADPARIGEGMRKIQETFAPQLRNVEGFVAYYAVEGEKGEIFTITLCQDREGVEETTRRARAFVERELKGFLRTSLDVMTGEVRVESTASASPASRERAPRRG